MIYTKTSKALSRISDKFRTKSIEKTYWAVVEKPPTQKKATLRDFLKKNEKQNKSYVVGEDESGAKLAVLHYEWLLSSDRYHLIEVQLETGRHHQIRAQLAHMGCIIKGDLKYGARRSNKDASIHLHSRAASFDHPVSDGQVRITAACPEDPIWQFFEQQLAG